MKQTASGPWTPSTVEGRWCGLGPYYAMFPVEFARRVVAAFCPPGGRVIDPFCGRGTTPFVAAMMGRHSIGTDVNPVAWIYSAVKLNPCANPDLIRSRVREIVSHVRKRDKVADHEFQKWAWDSDVLGFLRVARRELDWRTNRIDRTLMALILVHLHAKRGEGLSNQLRQAKSMSPDYAVRWWKDRRMPPPEIDIELFFDNKISWRYAKGIPTKRTEATARLGDARRILPQLESFQADLVFTSPPYFSVTNYEYDNWIRLWMLGWPSLPTYKAATRYGNSGKYHELLAGVFGRTRRHSKDGAIVYVRSDARDFTYGTTEEVLRSVWPDYVVSIRYDKKSGPSQTNLFYKEWSSGEEVDFLLTPRGVRIPPNFQRA